jgi:hypothetical protein
LVVSRKSVPTTAMALHEKSGNFSPASVDWSGLLQRSRTLREEPNAIRTSDFFLEVRAYFQAIRDLLQNYCNSLVDCKDLSKEEKKQLILDVRAALRIAITCTSWEESNLRASLVKGAVLESFWHAPLARLLSSSRGDVKCRTLAAQLLSNLVTSHYESALAISSSFPLSLSVAQVDERIWQNISGDDRSSDRTSERGSEKPTWVEMILECARSDDRQAVAGIAAALHNSIISLQQAEESTINQPVAFAQEVSSNNMLVSTCLRQMISLQSVKQAIEKRKDDCQDAISEEESLVDTGTEWISLLLIKLTMLGLLPNLILAARGGAIEQPAALDMINVVPEHLVLLQLIRSEVETSACVKVSDNLHRNLLGGELGEQAVVSTHIFLANLFCSLRGTLAADSIASPVSNNDDPDTILKWSVLIAILEILASSLGVDSSDSSLARIKLGEDGSTTIIQDVSQELGSLVDTLSARNFGRRSREFYMSDEEQRIVTALVRVIGNLCFQCRQNQDLVRLTKVPTPIHVIPAEGDEVPQERNALHVLLSCTSFAHSCFTLREWAVVSIRNLLDKNELNQAEVAKLEANQPIQSAELGNLGIRINLDPKGNVSVAPNDG